MKTWDDVAKQFNLATLALQETIHSFKSLSHTYRELFPYSLENTIDSEGYIETKFGEN